MESKLMEDLAQVFTEHGITAFFLVLNDGAYGHLISSGKAVLILDTLGQMIGQNPAIESLLKTALKQGKKNRMKELIRGFGLAFSCN